MAGLTWAVLQTNSRKKIDWRDLLLFPEEPPGSEGLSAQEKRWMARLAKAGG